MPPEATSWALRSSPRSAACGQELVQPPLGVQVGLGDPAAVLAEHHLLVGRAVERRRAVAGQQHDVAGLAERRRRTASDASSSTPTTPTTGVGWIGRPKCSL